MYNSRSGRAWERGYQHAQLLYKQPHSQTTGVKQPHSQTTGVKQPHSQTTGAKQPHSQTTGAKQPHSQTTGAKQPHSQTTGAKQPHSQTTGAKQPHSQTTGAKQPHSQATAQLFVSKQQKLGVGQAGLHLGGGGKRGASPPFLFAGFRPSLRIYKLVCKRIVASQYSILPPP